MKEAKVYLEDILESIGKIEHYVSDLTAMKFADNSAMQDAVMRRLEIIGEAVKHLSDELKASQPNIPWKDIAGMRDILIHEYAGVQLGRIWRTVQNDLPPLKTAVKKMLGKSDQKHHSPHHRSGGDR